MSTDRVRDAAGKVPGRAVATVTECEACFTPDVCQLRGTCDHYRAELLRVAAQALPQQMPERCHADRGGTYGCACPDRDSLQCAAIRYSMDHYGEACECPCHQWSDDDEY